MSTDFIAHLHEHLLLEAAEYRSMFNDVERYLPLFPERDAGPFRTKIAAAISDARKTLKKNDRVVWFLRLYKIGLLHELALMPTIPGTPQEQVASVANAWEKLLDAARIKANASRETVGYDAIKLFRNTTDVLQRLGHFLSLPIASIQNHVFGHETYTAILTRFQTAEREWQESTKDLIPYDPDDGEVVLKFPDGMFWLLLPRGACQKEGTAMGHCGNVPTVRAGDRILTLRRMVKQGGKTYARPSLTFILHKGGLLGEMKGRKNNKPSPQYFPHIVALLRTDLIRGIVGGGYEPEGNFSLDDLPENIHQQLIAEKPELASLRDYYKLRGFDEAVQAKLEWYFADAGWEVRWSEDRQWAVVAEYKNIKDLVRQHGDDHAKWVVATLEGETDLDFAYEWSYEGAENMFTSLPKESRLKIGDYVAKTYKDEIAAREDEEGVDFNPKDKSDVLYFLSENHDDIFDDLKRARVYGLESGTMEQMRKMLEKGVRAFSPYLVVENEGSYLDLEVSKVRMEMPVAKLVDLFSRLSQDDIRRLIEDRFTEDEDHVLRVPEPSYGYEDMDDEAALGYFFDEHPEFRAQPKLETPAVTVKTGSPDTSGWTVETTKENGFTGQRDVTVRDAEGRLIGMRSGTRATDQQVIADFASRLPG